MGSAPMKERACIIDIESCLNTSKEAGTPALSDDKVGNVVSSTIDDIVNVENSASLWSKHNTVDELSLESGKNDNRTNRKSMSTKKPPKPPRPPRGLSLDAADQMLIKEISELAMIKRARIERTKALKKMKEAKTSSASTSSRGNWIAIVFTIVLCIVIIFQGCHSSGTSPGNRSAVPITGSLESHGVGEGNIAVMQDQQNLATTVLPSTNVESPNVMELIPGSDSKEEVEKAIH